MVEENETSHSEMQEASASPAETTPPLKKQKQASAAANNKTSETRRLAQASRTLKACELCRKQKTRCFRSPENPNSCLRCRFISKVCSFEDEASKEADGLRSSSDTAVDFNNNTGNNTINGNGDKLDMIWNGVQELIRICKGNQALREMIGRDSRLSFGAGGTLIPKNNGGGGGSSVHSRSNSMLPIGDMDQNAPIFQASSSTLKTSPFAIVNRECEFKPMSVNPTPITSLFTSARTERGGPSHNSLLDLGILTEAEVVDLIEDFRRNYGRWVSFPASRATEELVLDLKYKSPLLLTTCCCMSIRYSIHDDEVNTEKFRQMIRVLIHDLNQAFLKYTCFTDNEYGLVEFLQSLVVLSIYATSMSALVASVAQSDEDPELVGFNLDPWQLSSVGITTFLTKSTFQLFKTTESSASGGGSGSGSGNGNGGVGVSSSSNLGRGAPSPHAASPAMGQYETLTILRIYNHLCLVHMVNSVFSGRMAVLDDARIRYCSSALSLFNATNFDGRMVAEVGVLQTAYKYLQLGNDESLKRSPSLMEADFQIVLKDMAEWHQNWDYLLQQPALQFIEYTYNFCSMLIYYFRLFQRTETEANDAGKKKMMDLTNANQVLSQASVEELVKMYSHSQAVIFHINAINNDSYVAYLSDQIHFCAYYCGMIYIKVAALLVEKGQSSSLLEAKELTTKAGRNKVLKTVELLTDKFSRIIMKEGEDIISKFANSLDFCLQEVSHVFLY
ncbi:uncharacterized protein LODBEIA_P17600 [Lodderomyces beijingensis]|uniref:Zn(2)-C6 fungal-type domain-containing protein n=1 Tax=Lodderomyces beijingensis TaxID=1775926 RepID=A0ABP0ZK74_9ASCO